MKKLSNRLGFVNRRTLCAVLCLACLALALSAVREAVAQGSGSGTPAIQGINRGLSPVVKFDVSPPLREMGIILPGPGAIPQNEDREIVPLKLHFAPEWDPVVQTTQGGNNGSKETEIPGPLVSFSGQTNASGVVPPDPNGAVGPNHIVTMCNLSFQIFDKVGNTLFGPAANNTLWAG